MVKRKQKLTRKMLLNLYYVRAKTLREIGDEHGITRERVRQIMEKFEIPRIKGRVNHPAGAVYQDLESYFNAHGKRKADSTTLKRLLGACFCSECGSERYLDLHHLNYPATSIKDIQILCRSCHKIKHNKGMTYEKQILLYQAYIQGVGYSKLMSEFGISESAVYRIINKIKKGYRTWRG